ncbi:MAG TPA: DUF6268 family outer membrane beta-barrel protein [Puia sp.]|jgi:hypothetical protein|nr:DUF6268 family outer membrane beta-barrel protein [Puia sp.]
MKKTASFIVLFISVSASAQQKNGAELNINETGTRYSDTSAHVRVIDFKTHFPLYTLKGSQFSGNFSYINEKFSDFPAAYGTDLNGLSAGLSWSRSLGQRHMLMITGDGGIYSDFVTWSSRSIRERGGFTYLTRYSERLSIGFGLEYRNQFYGNQISPVIFILYTFRDNDHWKLSGVLPFNPKLTYQVNPGNGISLEVKQTYSSYLLTAAKDSGNYVRNRKLVAALNYEHPFARNWRFNAGIGYAARQGYELYNNSTPREWYLINTPLGKKPVPIESISHRGIQFTAGLVFHPKF